MKDSQLAPPTQHAALKYIKVNNERFSTKILSLEPVPVSISRRVMKDSQLIRYRVVFRGKYIKESNERFSTGWSSATGAL